MHPGGLSHGIRGITGHIPDQNASFAASLNVDVVDACSGLADKLKLRCGVQELIVYDNLVHNGDITVRSPLARLLRGRRFIADKFAESGNFRHRGVTHRKGVKEHNFHSVKY